MSSSDKKSNAENSREGAIDPARNPGHPQAMDRQQEAADKKENEAITDPQRDISQQEVEDLEKAAEDTSSDESRNADLLEDADSEGTPLNEGPDDSNLFNTGEDLDVAPDDLTPDNNAANGE